MGLTPVARSSQSCRTVANAGGVCRIFPKCASPAVTTTSFEPSPVFFSSLVGFQDEVWWSRLAQPIRYAWTEDTPLRIRQHEPDRHDPAPKALACYGVLRADTHGMLLRFVNGRSVSVVTTQFLAWLTERLAAEGNTALLMVWDHASWPVS
jgi:hypothetical protein